MEMTPQRWEATKVYLREVFGCEDDVLRSLMDEARAAGLPEIAVSAEVGRLLMILTRMTPGRLAIEVGTLGGYSAIWIARGLHAGGRLITIESEPAHVAFARCQFDRAGLTDRVQLREGAALDVLPHLAREVDAGSVDLVFLDAEKEEYPEYWRLVRPLIAPGGVIAIDNALGSGSWWIDQPGHPARDAADRVNRMIADDADFEAVGIPLRQGVSIALRVK